MSESQRSVIPDGLTRCEACGELKGTFLYPELPGGEGDLVATTVQCLCDGLICASCGKGRIHRPISNYYEEKTGTVIHVPHFRAEQRCPECGVRACTEVGTTP